MRTTQKTNYLIVASLLLIVVAFIAYATIAIQWIVSPKASTPQAQINAQAAATATLNDARKKFRQHLLDPRAHLRLSEALWKAGRPVDAYYVMRSARQIFSDAAFRKSHADIVTGVGGPAAEIRERLKGLNDIVTTIPIHAEVARDYPQSPEGRDSLNQRSYDGE
jgi:hypothetical protein